MKVTHKNRGGMLIQLCLTVFVVAACLVTVVGAQGWEEVSLPANTLINVVGSTCPSSTECIIIGSQSDTFSSFLRSVDSGATWTLSQKTFGIKLNDVDSKTISGTNFAIAVSEAGAIYASINTGATWTLSATLSSTTLFGATMGPNGQAYVVGLAGSNAAVYSAVYTDLTSWTDISPSTPAASRLNGVSTYDGINVIAVGKNGIIYTSQDSGTLWNSVTVTACSGAEMFGVDFFSATLAIAVGELGCMLKSTDGGSSWSQISDPLITSSVDFRFHSVQITTIFIVYVSTNDGDILKSVDSGESWTVDYTAVGTIFYSLSMYDYGIGVAGTAVDNKIHIRTRDPSVRPSSQPSSSPSVNPSTQPSACPSMQPSSQPTCEPTTQPSMKPSIQPSMQPSLHPSVQPSNSPSQQPSTQPSARPSAQPSSLPSMQPTSAPSTIPTQQPSASPSCQPSSRPSTQPSVQPTNDPSTQPTARPSGQPSFWPTAQPSAQPSSNPTSSWPTSVPTGFLENGTWTNVPTSAATSVSMLTAKCSTKRICLMAGRDTLLDKGVIVRSEQSGAVGTWSTIMSLDSRGFSDMVYVTVPSFLTYYYFVAEFLTGIIYRSTDHGLTFHEVYDTGGDKLQAMATIADNQVFVLGTSKVYLSDEAFDFSTYPGTEYNGWEEYSFSLPETYYGMAMIRNSKWIMVGTGGDIQFCDINLNILSCSSRTSPTTDTLISVSASQNRNFGDDDNVVLFAVTNTGSIIKSETSGSVWLLLEATVPAYAAVNGVFGKLVYVYNDAITYIVTSNGNVARSIDFGFHWENATTIGQDSGLPLYSIDMYNTAIGIAGGSLGNAFLRRPIATGAPSGYPSSSPSMQPSRQPSVKPTTQPSKQPSTRPTSQPTIQPSTQPSRVPSSQPSSQPSTQPSRTPSGRPTEQPTGQPSRLPSFEPTRQPSAAPSKQPSRSPTGQPSCQPSVQPSRSPSNQPTVQPSNQPSCIPSTSPTSQPSLDPTSQPSRLPSGQPTAQPSRLPTSQPSRSPSRQPSLQPSRSPTMQPTSQPTRIPTTQPSQIPTEQPSSQPSRRPSDQPTGQPSRQPSLQPSLQPTRQPTGQPSKSPSRQPTAIPTRQPTGQPSKSPTRQPTRQPSRVPSGQPTLGPSAQPTRQPSRTPTRQPSRKPSSMPSGAPTSQPSRQPSRQPSLTPTREPSRAPTNQPSRQPTRQPSNSPSVQPTRQPSRTPTSVPTNQPSRQPTRVPSQQPSRQPTTQPSRTPSRQPTNRPSGVPSRSPSQRPSSQPTVQPSRQPSLAPSAQPSKCPTVQPSNQPSRQPTVQPTSQPVCEPSRQPTAQPSSRPSRIPSAQPSSRPSKCPSSSPSKCPSSQPSTGPSSFPTRQPSGLPSIQPSVSPSAQPSTRPSKSPSQQPTSQPTRQPTFQPSNSPTEQPSNRPSMSPSDQPTSRPTEQPTVQPSRRPSLQPSNIPTKTPSSRPSMQPSKQPTSQPSRQPTYQPVDGPSSQPSSRPSKCPSTQPTFQPSKQPTVQPSDSPSEQPSSRPSNQPTAQPVMVPTSIPTHQPSRVPTQQPTCRPTSEPSRQPSGHPSKQPTVQPSKQPSVQPTGQPTEQPVASPSSQPSKCPTGQPSRQPTTSPSNQPSKCPTAQPSRQPSRRPTTQPTEQPVMSPTCQPSAQPVSQPSAQPISNPTSQPSYRPSSQPSSTPSLQPFAAPTSDPSSQPIDMPTVQPSSYPSEQPSAQPMAPPTSEPTGQPSCVPTHQPATMPSSLPSCQPTSEPSQQPASVPSAGPSTYPSVHPSQQPSTSPSQQPSAVPSSEPSVQPSSRPSMMPSAQPISAPSSMPSGVPTMLPSLQPTTEPSSLPSSLPTDGPSAIPSQQPSSAPSHIPSSSPSMQPSSSPTCSPSIAPSVVPSLQPYSAPTSSPSVLPSCVPSRSPSMRPSVSPSREPTSQPSIQPTTVPSVQPTRRPTHGPSSRPSSLPSMKPSSQPQACPTSVPSCQPTRQPFSHPSSLPSVQPSRSPSAQPSSVPTSSSPTCQPSGVPSLQPSSIPTLQPTLALTRYYLVVVAQALSGLTKAQFDADENAGITFSQTVMEILGDINEVQDVQILVTYNGVEYLINNASSYLTLAQTAATERFLTFSVAYPSSTDTTTTTTAATRGDSSSSMSAILLDSNHSVERESREQDMARRTSMYLTADGNSLTVVYSVIFVPKVVNGEYHDVAGTRTKIVDLLSPQVQNGVFLSTLVNNAGILSSSSLLSSTATSLLNISVTVNGSMVHSPKPTSQPSSIPSGQPSPVPSMCPSTQPSSMPSNQPSVQPSGQPTSMPSLSLETRYRTQLLDIVTEYASPYAYERNVFGTIVVDNKHLFGTCDEWNAFLRDELPLSLSEKTANYISIIAQSGLSTGKYTENNDDFYAAIESPSLTVELRCETRKAVEYITRALTIAASKVAGSSSANYIAVPAETGTGDDLRASDLNSESIYAGVSILCENVWWRVRECGSAAAPRRAVCANCDDPCASTYSSNGGSLPSTYDSVDSRPYCFLYNATAPSQSSVVLSHPCADDGIFDDDDDDGDDIALHQCSLTNCRDVQHEESLVRVLIVDFEQEENGIYFALFSFVSLVFAGLCCAVIFATKESIYGSYQKTVDKINERRAKARASAILAEEVALAGERNDSEDFYTYTTQSMPEGEDTLEFDSGPNPLFLARKGGRGASASGSGSVSVSGRNKSSKKAVGSTVVSFFEETNVQVNAIFSGSYFGNDGLSDWQKVASAIASYHFLLSPFKTGMTAKDRARQWALLYFRIVLTAFFFSVVYNAQYNPDDGTCAQASGSESECLELRTTVDRDTHLCSWKPAPYLFPGDNSRTVQPRCVWNGFNTSGAVLVRLAAVSLMCMISLRLILNKDNFSGFASRKKIFTFLKVNSLRLCIDKLEALAVTLGSLTGGWLRCFETEHAKLAIGSYDIIPSVNDLVLVYDSFKGNAPLARPAVAAGSTVITQSSLVAQTSSSFAAASTTDDADIGFVAEAKKASMAEAVSKLKMDTTQEEDEEVAQVDGKRESSPELNESGFPVSKYSGAEYDMSGSSMKAAASTAPVGKVSLRRAPSLSSQVTTAADKAKLLKSASRKLSSKASTQSAAAAYHQASQSSRSLPGATHSLFNTFFESLVRHRSTLNHEEKLVFDDEWLAHDSMQSNNTSDEKWLLCNSEEVQRYERQLRGFHSNDIKERMKNSIKTKAALSQYTLASEIRNTLRVHREIVSDAIEDIPRNKVVLSRGVLLLFILDLMGANSFYGLVFKRVMRSTMHNQLSRHLYPQGGADERFRMDALTIVLIIITILLVFYCIYTTRDKPRDLNNYWIGLCFLLVFFDAAVLEVCELLWANVVLPRMTLAPVTAALDTIAEFCGYLDDDAAAARTCGRDDDEEEEDDDDEFTKEKKLVQNAQKAMVVSATSLVQNLNGVGRDSDPEYGFNVSDYLSVARRISAVYPSLKESQMVLRYRCRAPPQYLLRQCGLKPLPAVKPEDQATPKIALPISTSRVASEEDIADSDDKRDVLRPAAGSVQSVEASPNKNGSSSSSSLEKKKTEELEEDYIDEEESPFTGLFRALRGLIWSAALFYAGMLPIGVQKSIVSSFVISIVWIVYSAVELSGAQLVGGLILFVILLLMAAFTIRAVLRSGLLVSYVPSSKASPSVSPQEEDDDDIAGESNGDGGQSGGSDEEQGGPEGGRPSLVPNMWDVQGLQGGRGSAAISPSSYNAHTVTTDGHLEIAVQKSSQTQSTKKIHPSAVAPLPTGGGDGDGVQSANRLHQHFKTLPMENKKLTSPVRVGGAGAGGSSATTGNGAAMFDFPPQQLFASSPPQDLMGYASSHKSPTQSPSYHIHGFQNPSQKSAAATTPSNVHLGNMYDMSDSESDSDDDILDDYRLNARATTRSVDFNSDGEDGAPAFNSRSTHNQSNNSNSGRRGNEDLEEESKANTRSGDLMMMQNLES